MKEKIIEELEQRIADECTAIDREKRFDELLDDCYSFEKVGGPFAHMMPSRVLKEIDPVCYRCGVNDFEDSEGWIEVGGEYYDHEAVDTVIEDLTDELESMLEDANSAIEEAEEAEDNDEIEEAKAEVERIKSQIQELKDHSF